ncbi:MAG: phage antirepressor KilAC domain-containing protein [Bacteroidaceae bacterium]|nr:phage antirepressor KilAC domain-containing protein [Bacteroidaceae bacterium]
MKNISSTIPAGIQIFKNADFGSVRTLVDEGGMPQFCLKDVCQALALDGKQVARRLDDEVVSKHPITDSLGRTQLATFVNEDGLYDTILDSRKPAARAFRKWVTSEVLPQIRQTGGYIPTRNLRTGEGLTEGEVMQLADSIMQRTISRKNLPADDCLTASEVAQALEMTTTELNKWLVVLGVQYWNGSRYRLKGEYEGMGYASERLFHYYGLDGEKKQRSYLVWTPAGAAFIKEILFNN